MMMDTEEHCAEPPGSANDPPQSSPLEANNKNSRKRAISSPQGLRKSAPGPTDYYFIGQPEERFVDDATTEFFVNSDLNRNKYGKESSVTLEEIKESISSPLIYKK